MVKAVALNNDGATNGVTAPSSEAQERVIVQAWKDADIDPGQLSYLEAHGTGTTVGDRIEMRALTNAFERFTTKRQFCGSRHGEAQHRPRGRGIRDGRPLQSRHGDGARNPAAECQLRGAEPRKIGFANSPMFMVDSPLPWPKDTARLAGVSLLRLQRHEQPRRPASPPPQTSPSGRRRLEVLTLSTHARTLWPALLDAYLEHLCSPSGQLAS